MKFLLLAHYIMWINFWQGVDGCLDRIFRIGAGPCTDVGTAVVLEGLGYGSRGEALS